MEDSVLPPPLLLITGISGYLGSHVCLQALSDGDFRVRGSVRSIEKSKPILIKALGEELFEKLELVEMNLLNEKQIDKAIEGCQYVIHIASPFPHKEPKNEEEVIEPAFKGTLYVMRAAYKHKVKRVVMTSSVSTIALNKNKTIANQQIDERQWSDPSICNIYQKSKVMAEKAAWEYIESLKSKDRFLLVVLNPSFLIGPTLTGQSFASGEITIKKIMGEFGTAKFQIPLTDVRDCARAHILAITSENIKKSQRIIICCASLWNKDVSQILKDNFPDYSVKTREIPFIFTKIYSFFDDTVKMAMHQWNKELILDNSESVNKLGLMYREITTSIIEGTQNMIDCGIIKPKKKKKNGTGSASDINQTRSESQFEELKEEI